MTNRFSTAHFQMDPGPTRVPVGISGCATVLLLLPLFGSWVLKDHWPLFTLTSILLSANFYGSLKGPALNFSKKTPVFLLCYKLIPSIQNSSADSEKVWVIFNTPVSQACDRRYLHYFLITLWYMGAHFSQLENQLKRRKKRVTIKVKTSFQ